MGQRFATLFLTAVSCALVLAGCAGNEAQIDAPLDALNAPTAGLPALPLFDPAAPRSISYSDTIVIEGADTWQRSFNVGEVGGGLELRPLINPSWAMYQFSTLFPADEISLLSVHLGGTLPGKLWVGVSNFEQQRWDWQEVSNPASDFSIPLLDPALNSSSAGNLYIVLLSMNEEVQIESLTLLARYIALPPQELAASDGTSKTAIELTWTDPAITYAGDPDFEYEAIAIERSVQPGTLWSTIATVDAGVTEYHDTSLVAVAGPTRYYRLRTIHNAEPGVPGIVETGYADKLPVVSVPWIVSGTFQHAPAYLTIGVVSASDPDGGPLTYEWDIGGTGNWLSTGAQATIQAPFLDIIPVGVRVTDDEGNSAENSVALPHSTDNFLGRAQGWDISAAGHPDVEIVYSTTDGTADTVHAGQHGVLAKLDGVTELEWVRRWEQVDFTLLACSETGFTYAFSGSTVVYLDQEGDVLWAHELGDPTYLAGSALVDVDESLWVLGANSSDEAVLSHVLADGTLDFYATLNDSNGDLTVAGNDSLAKDEAGYLYALFSRTVSGVTQPLVIMFDADGNSLWQRQVDTGESATPHGVEWLFDKLYVSSATGVSSGNLITLDSAGLVTSAQTTSEFQPGELHGNMCAAERGFYALSGYDGRKLWTRPTGDLTLFAGHGLRGSVELTENWESDSITLQTANATVIDASVVMTPQSPGWTARNLTELNGTTMVKDNAGTMLIDYWLQQYPPPPGPD